MESLLLQQEKTNTIKKKYVIQGFILLDVLCVKIWMYYN